MIHKHLIRLSHILVFVSLIITLPACGAPATQSPALTQPPATEPPATEAPAATEAPTVTQYTVIYAFPDTGIAFLLTPAEEAPGPTAEELVKDPETIENKVLGELTVIQQTNDALPTDNYHITLAPDMTVKFTGENNSASFDAVIRSLPLALPQERPVALITSSQMCLAWGTTQICALVDTPLPNDLKSQVEAAIKDLGADPAGFALDRAIPDIEGHGMVDACTEALSKTPPAYGNCKATVLATSAIKDSAFPTPQVQSTSTPNPTLQVQSTSTPSQGTISGIGVLLVLEDLQDEIYVDPQLTQPIEILPKGNYLSYVVLPDGVTPVPGEPIATSILQSGPNENFYLPAVSGGVIIGSALSGAGPTNEEEAIIVNLWIGSNCYFKWRQCRWLLSQ